MPTSNSASTVVDALHARFPVLHGPASDDICYATTNRQDALKAIADESDLVLVVGSVNSSNSRRLVELARRHDRRRTRNAHTTRSTGRATPTILPSHGRRRARLSPVHDHHPSLRAP